VVFDLCPGNLAAQPATQEIPPPAVHVGADCPTTEHAGEFTCARLVSERTVVVQVMRFAHGVHRADAGDPRPDADADPRYPTPSAGSVRLMTVRSRSFS
jgi:hypothetical protein